MIGCQRDSLLEDGSGRDVLERRAGNGYNDPSSGGGSMLTIVNGTYPAGQGEPLNIILSANSAKEVLVDSLDNGGFLNYMLSTYMGEECLGQHLGASQQANLGDASGAVDEVQELRWNYGNPYLGTCQETFNGGLHLRYWIQNTTGAYFIAISVEKSLSDGHDIVLDGYNLGREYLIGNLTNQTTTIYTPNITAQSTFSGDSAYSNWTYNTKVNYVSGLLQNTSVGINHNITVQGANFNAIDGLVAVLTVSVVDRPKSSLAWATLRLSIPTLLVALFGTALFTIL